MAKERIDVLLVERGFVETREKAKKTVMAGLVLIGTERVDKPGTKVDRESEIRVKGDVMPYVSRGGLKLEKALKEFPITVENKVAMDIGASTGGFTDCMLQNGAVKVYAIDVGYGQLAWKIRNEERVVVMERTNVRYLEEKDIEEKADLISIDVSFISLRLILPVAKALSNEDVDIVALIKPQFEAGREKVGKKGVVRDKNVHIEVIQEIYNFCRANGMTFKGLSFSPITGAEGNREYLAHIVKGDKAYIEDIDKEIEDIVAKSHETL